MPKRKNGTETTIKEKLLVTSYIKNNFNGTKAALEVYDTTKENAGNLGAQVLNKPAVQQELKDQLNKAGLSLSYLHDKAYDAIQAGTGVKATQKDANNMIQFLYKLHNAVPSSINKSMKITLNGQLAPENVDVVIGKLKGMSNKSNELIEDIS